MGSISSSVRIMRSLRNVVEQIWENAELRHFPHNPCYLSRRLKGGERSGVRSEAEQVHFLAISVYHIQK